MVRRLVSIMRLLLAKILGKPQYIKVLKSFLLHSILIFRIVPIFRRNCKEEERRLNYPENYTAGDGRKLLRFLI